MIYFRMLDHVLMCFGSLCGSLKNCRTVGSLLVVPAAYDFAGHT